MDKNTKASEIPLVSIRDLKSGLRRILESDKPQSDRKLEEFQESNRKKREAKKKKR